MMKFFKDFKGYFINMMYDKILKYKYIEKWDKDTSGSLIRNAFYENNN